jgi:gluconate 5-dehydrogenase
MVNFHLTGRTALVAGASRGIGLALARAYAQAGARTVLAARSEEALAREAAALTAGGYDAHARALDVTDPASIAALAAAEPYDILVNVSGTNLRKRFEDYTPAEYERIMTTNLHGMVEVTREVGRRMKQRVERGEASGAKIIHIGSITSVLGLPYLSVYGMTKSALWGLTRALAAEWAPWNIQVNCIGPGFIETDLTREAWRPEKMRAWLRGAQSNPRMGTPEDIAPLAVFLAGAGSDYITGQLIMVDGGHSTTETWPLEPAS